MSTTKPNRSKPAKPYQGFPLTAHPNGQWCKKIRGKVHFFGVWADPMAALENYNRQAADLQAGRRPRPPESPAGPTIKDLANAYLSMQHEKAERGLITPSWLRDCLDTARAFVGFAGGDRPWADLRPDDFTGYRMDLYSRYGVCAVDRAITVVRAIFKHAYETDLIDRPVKYGGQFSKPTAKEKRQSRSRRERENGKRLFTASHIHTLLEHANGHLKAMILLGINGGFGNTDCAELPLSAVELDGALIDYERPKTAVQRVVPLWSETVLALRAAVASRPVPKKPEYSGLLFLTVFGNPWRNDRLHLANEGTGPRVSRQQAISAEFNKILKRTGMKRPGLGFYALRHTFRTWADEVKDQHAIHRIMGHAIPGMSGIYVEEIGMDRLRAVVDHVHDKLFATQ